MDNVATVDIAGLFGKDSETARSRVDAQVAKAIKDHGGFVISGFPGADEIDALATRMIRFFDLDEAEKLKVANVSTVPDATRIYRGYVSNLVPGRFAYNEMFDIGPDAPSPAPTEGSQPFAEENIWPEKEPAPGWKAAMQAYYDMLQTVGMAVLHSVGRSVGIQAEQLDTVFAGGNSTLRLINYPIPPEDFPGKEANLSEDGSPISAACHTDGSGLSILWSLQPGLQARSPDGTWRAIPQQDNCLSIHLGDVMESITGRRIPATPHRVVGHGIARQSIGFFLEPRLDAPLGLMDGADAESGERSTYGWLLQKRFSSYAAYKDIFPAPE